MDLNKNEAIILHYPANPAETVKLVTSEDLQQYIKDTSGSIAYGNKKERIQQAANLKAIISWLVSEIHSQPRGDV